MKYTVTKHVVVKATVEADSPREAHDFIEATNGEQAWQMFGEHGPNKQGICDVTIDWHDDVEETIHVADETGRTVLSYGKEVPQ